MSEKDIIDKFTEIVEDAREESWYEYYDALRNTLDLIKKLQQELQQEKEKNKKLDEKFRYAVPDDMISELYISKDKIKEKIEELKDKEQELTDEQGYWGGTALQEKIELLEQLLEK